MPLCFALPISRALKIERSGVTPFRCISSGSRVVSGATRLQVEAKDSAPSNDAIATTRRQYEGVTWSEVESMCSRIVQQAKTHQFDVVLAVTRGGLVPATLLCESFELRNVLSATVIFYTDDGDQFFGMTEPRFLSFPSADALEGRSVLVVDDVWDSGRTANAVRKRVLRASPKDVKVAVLHYKPDKNIFPGEEPDFYAAITSNWVLYPWERASPKTPHFTPHRDYLGSLEGEAESHPVNES